MKFRHLVFSATAFFLCLSCQKAETSLPVLTTPCGEVYPDEVVEELLALSDTSTLRTVPDLEYRLQSLSDIFSSYDDARGLFPTVYKATTEFAVTSLEDGAYTDEARAIHLSVAFGKRYLFNLHDHIMGRTPQYHWKQYYDLCQRCGYNKSRIAASGINAHLTVDLARAIADASAGPDFEQDYITFGEILGDASPNIVQYLKDSYDVDTEELFRGLFLGDILDPVFGEGFTTRFAFQYIRVEAFKFAQYLQRPVTEEDAQKGMKDNWRSREELLDVLLRQGLLN